MIKFNPWLSLVLVTTISFGNATLAAQEDGKDISAVEKDVRSRLFPCPHHIRCKGEVVVDVKELVLLKPSSPSTVLSDAVENVCAEIVRLCGQKPRVAMQCPADAAYVMRFSEERIPELPSGTRGTKASSPQGYLIKPSRYGNVPTLLLAGNDSAGALYATQTLRQLLRADDNKRLIIPKVEINDAPDLEDRGYFLDIRREPLTWDLDDWKRHIDWAAEQRFNTILVQIANGKGLTYPSQAFAEFVDKKHPFSTPGLLPAIIEYGRRRAVRVVPTIPHIDAYLPSLFEKNIPGVVTSITRNGKERKVLDIRPPEVNNVLRHLVQDLIEVTQPDELGAWPTEAPWYTPEDSLAQVISLYKACKSATQNGPNVTIRMLTTPRTFHVSEKMFKQLPPTVKVDYYGAMETYTLRGMRFHEATVSSLQRGGFNFSTMPAFGRFFWQCLPLALPDLTRGNAVASAQKGARGLVANGGDQPTAFAVNYAAGAEFSWNLNGRTTREFLKALAVVRQLPLPERVANFYTHLEKASIALSLANDEDFRASKPSTNLEGLSKTAPAKRRKEHIEPLEGAVNEAQIAATEANAIGDERLIAEAEVIRSLSAALLALHRGFAARDQDSPEAGDYFAAAQQEFKRLEKVWVTVKQLNPGTTPAGPVASLRRDLSKFLTSIQKADDKG